MQRLVCCSCLSQLLKGKCVFASTATSCKASMSRQTCKHTQKIRGKTYSLVLHISDINRWQMEAVIAGEIINNSVKYFSNQSNAFT